MICQEVKVSYIMKMPHIDFKFIFSEFKNHFQLTNGTFAHFLGDGRYPRIGSYL